MATLAPPVKGSTPNEIAAAEQALLDIFEDIDSKLTPDQRADFYSELRENAIAHGE